MRTPLPAGARPLTVLVVDDEPPAITQMRWLLASEPLAGTVYSATSVAQAQAVLNTQQIDVVLLDIHLPGPSGLDLARQLRQQHTQDDAPEAPSGPQLIFVTADARPAVEAFELEARDYLLKPVRAQRLHEALRKVLLGTEPVAVGTGSDAGAGHPGATTSTVGIGAEERVTVLQGDTRVLVPISSIRWAQAQGDYARLHTDTGSYLLRISMGDVEEQWSRHGFVRIHRSHVVNLNHAQRILQRSGRMSIQLGDTELPVSRRLMPQVRERLEALSIRPRLRDT